MVGVTVGVILLLLGGGVSTKGASPIIAIKSLDIPWGSGSVSGILMTLFSSAIVTEEGGVGVATGLPDLEPATPKSAIWCTTVSSNIGSSLILVKVGTICSSLLLLQTVSSTTSIGSILDMGSCSGTILTGSTRLTGGVAATTMGVAVGVAAAATAVTIGRVLSEKTSSLSKSTEHALVLNLPDPEPDPDF